MLLLAMSAGINAQSLKSWVWDTYKIKFQAPDNLVLKKNDATIFEAGNNYMYLDIYPNKGNQMTYDGMRSSLIQWASTTGIQYQAVNSSGQSQPIYLSNLNGFWGCAIDGAKDNLPATILLIVNPNDPTLSFYIWINYQQSYYHDAVAVLKSFTPMDESSANVQTQSNTQSKSTPVKPKKKKTSTSSSVF